MVCVQHVVIPVATEADAEATCRALEPHLADLERVSAVHVIEKNVGAPDKAPMAMRQEEGADIMATVDRELGDRVAIDTEVWFGSDVVDALFEATVELGGEAIAFRARGGSRVVRLLAGDTASRLVTDPPVPAISLPSVE